MTRRWVAAALMTALIATACAGSLPRGGEAAGPGTVEALSHVVNAWRRRTPAPGVVVAVTGRSNQLVASGDTRREAGEPITAAAQFRVGSITKTMVATVVIQLAEEGRFSLDEQAARFLAPGSPATGMLAGVSIRDLLGHTSGIPDVGRSQRLVEALLSDPDQVWAPEEVIAVAAGADREFEPGAGFGYSNTNYLLLGELIEAITGRPWWQELRMRLLDPLEMGNSYVAGQERATGPLVPGYFDTDGDGFTEPVHDPWPALDTSEGAAGALVSTAGDLSRFAEALFGGELVSAASLAQMTEPGVHSSRYTGYGLGTEVRHPDLETTVWGHGGFVPGHRAVLWHAPAEQVTVVVLTNESRSRPDGLAELVLASHP